MTKEPRLSHLSEAGDAAMVDVGDKPDTKRLAIAEARLHMAGETLRLLMSGETPKGDVFAAARIAGIMAAKRTSELIPLCHPLPLSKVSIDLTAEEDRPAVHIRAAVTTTGKTGVEMEALTAASIAGLTLYDMLKAVDKSMVLDTVRVLRKEGGRSGLYTVSGDESA